MLLSPNLLTPVLYTRRDDRGKYYASIYDIRATVGDTTTATDTDDNFKVKCQSDGELISTFTNYFPIDMGFWYTFLGVATAVSQVVLNLSPVPDICKVHRRQRIGELAALPLVAMVVNCHFWLVYAYVTDSMFPLFATQVFGQLAAIVYNIIYYRWSVPEKRKELRRLYAWAFAAHCGLTVYTIIGSLGVTNQSNSEIGTYLGYVGIVIDVWMFGSPLGTLKHVIETKSAASIPINLSVMLFVCTTLWVVSGMVDSDYFLAGLNAIGSILSIIQIVFYFIYRPTDEDSAQSGVTESADEISVFVTPNTKTMSFPSPVYKMMLSPTTHQAR